MKIKRILFPGNIKEARKIQAELLNRLKIMPLKRQPKTVAAADAAFSEKEVMAGVCLFSFPDLKLLEIQTATEPLLFPYRTGYLSFCEGPAIYKAISKLGREPSLLLLDGQGIAHPRKMGIATFIGIILDTPSIGCAKSILVGKFEQPGIRKGSASEIFHQKEFLGYALRSRTGVKPIFVSPGHLIDQKDSLRIVHLCLSEFRVPEPLRQAHLLSKKIKSLRL